MTRTTMTSTTTVAALLVAALLGLGLAGAATAQTASADVRWGTYRAVLKLPGGDLPFGLALEHDGQGAAAYLINGRERLRAGEVVITGTHVEIQMPGYLNHLVADAAGGELQGEIVVDKSGGKLQHIPLHASLAEHYRFFPPPAAGRRPTGNRHVAGRWAVTFTDDSGEHEATVGEFQQHGEQVTGTVLTTTGDHRFLAGEVHGDELYLSTFDGAHAFLYKGRFTANDVIAGDYWSGLAYHESWNARRDAHAALPDAYSLTTLHAGAGQFDFAFPDLAGNQVTAADSQFKGKVLVIALAGSWCPNCHDEAAFLAPLYRDYRAKGVEIVSLMFEHFGDFPQAVAATQRFRQHYGIEYTTLIAGISDKDDAARKLPSLEKVVAFPTTILVDRKGRVRKIHTGFSGPATGEHYTQFIKEFKTTLDELAAES